MYTQKGKKYIYSVIQANEFIQRGYRCLETGFNSKQRKYYRVFDYNEVQPYYETSSVSFCKYSADSLVMMYHC